MTETPQRLDPPASSGQPWHHVPIHQVLHDLQTSAERGLDDASVTDRRARFGSNRLTPRHDPGWIRRLFRQFHNPLVYLLLAAGLVKWGLGDLLDAAVILGVVAVNAWIGYLQEAKAERAIEALNRSLVTESSVIRSGNVIRVPSTDLVPGDVVALTSGDRVPADLRLINSRELQLSEAALTGESTTVGKRADQILDPLTPLADRLNMAYASTLVASGQGVGVVVGTGDHTEVGRISELISAAPSLETPLTRHMSAFGRRLLVVILALAALVAMVGFARGTPGAEILSASIALAVGAIPEGLPAAVTVTLAIGVARMARRRAIIRKLPAVETLGSTTVICSDKTGTLTQNEMTVKEVVVARDRVELTGNGYSPVGDVLLQGRAIRIGESEGLSECLLAGLLCNDSAVLAKGPHWEPQGDPTEVALIVAARKFGWSESEAKKTYARLDAIPFESQHQFMATLHEEAGSGRKRIYLKGAVEVVLGRCGAALDVEGRPTTLDAAAIHEEVARLAAAGLRVLAFARAEAGAGIQTLDIHSLPNDFTFLGIQAMIDPPRPEAIQAVAACHQAGIRVKMITGDHPGTALAIGRQMGLVTSHAGSPLPSVMTGRDLATLADASWAETADRVSVFARVSPEQKLRLVEALQSQGHIVAMTGDGVNDGPALKQANIGVAMGITGTEVAKEASDMVLTDDNFASIEAAVEEGRNVYDNLTKILCWALPSNLGQGLVILAAGLVGATLPILPLQVLWINLTTGGVLGLLLALEPKEPDLMQRSPRRPTAPMLSRAMLGQVTLVGLMILVAAFGLFRWELSRGAGLDAARTVALNTVAVIQAFSLLNCRSLRHSIATIGWFRNPWLWAGIAGALALQAAITYVPLFQQLFHTATIGWDEWIRILGAGIAGCVLVEAYKAWINRRRPVTSGSP